jgi:hypothetical protein
MIHSAVISIRYSSIILPKSAIKSSVDIEERHPEDDNDRDSNHSVGEILESSSCLSLESLVGEVYIIANNEDEGIEAESRTSDEIISGKN